MLTSTCSGPPDEVTHWTGRAVASRTRNSLRSVQRTWQAYRLQPHRSGAGTGGLVSRTATVELYEGPQRADDQRLVSNIVALRKNGPPIDALLAISGPQKALPYRFTHHTANDAWAELLEALAPVGRPLAKVQTDPHRWGAPQRF